jgi:hypothetical protein
MTVGDDDRSDIARLRAARPEALDQSSADGKELDAAVIQISNLPTIRVHHRPRGHAAPARLVLH